MSKRKMPSKGGPWVECKECKGRGSRTVIVGPHIDDFGANPGGPVLIDCRACKTRGFVKGNGVKSSSSVWLSDCKITQRRYYILNAVANGAKTIDAVAKACSISRDAAKSALLYLYYANILDKKYVNGNKIEYSIALRAHTWKVGDIYNDGIRIFSVEENQDLEKLNKSLKKPKAPNKTLGKLKKVSDNLSQSLEHVKPPKLKSPEKAKLPNTAIEVHTDDLYKIAELIRTFGYDTVKSIVNTINELKCNENDIILIIDIVNEIDGLLNLKK